jgi:hypothetical protein
MAKRKLSPEHLAKLQAGREARFAKNNEQILEAEVTETPNIQVAQPATGVTLSMEQFQMMLEKFSSKESTASDRGNVIERFSINPSHYKNPVEDLYDLPELRRFSMRENYIIEWSCTPTRYETADKTWYVEPRFELKLMKKQFDDDGNEVERIDNQGKKFYPRVVLGKASFFEDPPANIIEAELAGLTIDDLDSEEFQEKMRMYRYRFWIIERLNPRKIQASSSAIREEVIGGKVYEIQEYSKPV